jgi:very-short-patch-repair endonuclease
MHRQATLDAAIVDMAVSQHRLITLEQLLGSGATPRAVGGLVRRRWLQPMERGVYLVGPLPGPWSREMAVLLAHPRAVLGHWSAARVADLAGYEGRDVVCIIVPPGSSGRSAGVQAFRTSNLHATEWHTVHGLRTTTPARTLFDLAVPLGRAGDTRRLEQLVATALDQRLCTGDDIRAVVARHPRSRGAGLLRLVLGEDSEPGLSRSQAEEVLRDWLVAGDLGGWRQNARVARYEVDFAWPAERLVVEVDGWAWHSSRNRFERDRARDAALAAAGYTVLRFTWRQLEREPMKVVARIAAILGRLRGR